jgi:hypothetical protein
MSRVFKQDLVMQLWIDLLCEDKQLSHPAGFGSISTSSTSLEVLGLMEGGKNNISKFKSIELQILQVTKHIANRISRSLGRIPKADTRNKINANKCKECTIEIKKSMYIGINPCNTSNSIVHLSLL